MNYITMKRCKKKILWRLQTTHAALEILERKLLLLTEAVHAQRIEAVNMSFNYVVLLHVLTQITLNFANTNTYT